MSENLYFFFSNFKRTHRIVFFFKFWKFIMLQLFIHFDMIGDGGSWCYLPNLFKQVHNFFYSIYWRDCYYHYLLTDHLVKHSDTETSFFGEGGRLNEVTSFVLDCLDSICAIVLFLLRLFQWIFKIDIISVEVNLHI